MAIFLIEMTILSSLDVCGGLLLSVVAAPIIRIPVGLFTAVLLPGYLILRFVYPIVDADKRIWLLGLMVPTGTAFTGSVLLALNYFWRYSIGTAVLILVVFNLIAVSGLIWINTRQRKNRRLFSWILALDDRMSKRANSCKPAQSLIFIALPALFLLAAVLYAMNTPRQTLPLTEFYILSPERTITGPVIQDNQLKYGVINREGQEVEYRIVVYAKSSLMSEELWSESFILKDGEAIEPG